MAKLIRVGCISDGRENSGLLGCTGHLPQVRGIERAKAAARLSVSDSNSD